MDVCSVGKDVETIGGDGDAVKQMFETLFGYVMTVGVGSDFFNETGIYLKTSNSKNGQRRHKPCRVIFSSIKACSCRTEITLLGRF